jgi:hypothetical protein
MCAAVPAMCYAHISINACEEMVALHSTGAAQAVGDLSAGLYVCGSLSKQAGLTQKVLP